MQATVLEAAGGATAAQNESRAGKYLSFHLGQEEFAIRVMAVREIMGLQEITSVPQTPPYVKGVINLRGKVVPVVDLRVKFQMPEAAYTQRTCIIVVQVPGESGQVLTGIIVDGVSEVLNIAAGDIEDTPEFGHGVAIPYVLGMAKSKGKVKILLDIGKVLTAVELTGIEAALQG